MKYLLNLSALLCVFFSSFILLPSAFPQGSVVPTTAPAVPLMKTLQQIEPRTDLQATPAPAGVATTNANYTFIITQAGSYYLSANLFVTTPNGIQIAAEEVTLDLNGFSIVHTGSFSGIRGVEITAASHRASIRNGSIQGFSSGIFAPLPRACAFRDLAVTGCTDEGITTGDGALLESCRAHNNSGSAAITAGIGATLSNCTATQNTTGVGIGAGAGSSLSNCSVSSHSGTGNTPIGAGIGSSFTNCSAYNNTGSNQAIYASAGSSLTNCSAYGNTTSFAGINTGAAVTLSNCNASGNTSSSTSSAGIQTGKGCTVTACTAVNNTSSNGTLSATTGMGISVLSGSTIKNCTVQGNTGDGIQASANGQIVGNTCDGNGAGSGSGAGIHVTGQANRIEDNNVTNNTRGIEASSGATRDFIVRNTARTNTNNYVIVAGNRIAQIVVPAVNAADITSANLGSSDGFTNVDPWANFSY